jgi:hypothetical protein
MPGVDTVEPQQHTPVLPALGPDDDGAVLTGRVSVRHPRRIDRERVTDIRVRGGTVTLKLPVPRDRDGAPVQARVTGIAPIAGRGDKGEPPPPVQRQAPGARMRPGTGTDDPHGRLDDFVAPWRRVQCQVTRHDGVTARAGRWSPG